MNYNRRFRDDYETLYKGYQIGYWDQFDEYAQERMNKMNDPWVAFDSKNDKFVASGKTKQDVINKIKNGDFNLVEEFEHKSVKDDYRSLAKDHHTVDNQMARLTNMAGDIISEVKDFKTLYEDGEQDYEMLVNWFLADVQKTLDKMNRALDIIEADE